MEHVVVGAGVAVVNVAVVGGNVLVVRWVGSCNAVETPVTRLCFDLRGWKHYNKGPAQYGIS